MKICFIVIGNSNRNGIVNGETIRYGGVGVSGTDQSTILIAEYLSSIGHDVTVAVEKGDQGMFVRGVYYTDIAFESVPANKREYDILVTMLWFDKYDVLPIRVSKAIVIVQHMQYAYSVSDILNYVNKHNIPKVGIIHVSEWEKIKTDAIYASLFPGCKQETIHNPIMLDIANEVASECIERDSHSIVYTAAWNRGAELCKKIFQDHLPWDDKKFIYADYTLCSLSFHNDPNIVELGALDKKHLFQKMSKCEYFIYPCVNAGPGSVHYDTFGCVVAEALALGVIVICYPLGALPSVFKDCCAFLEFPNGVDVNGLSNGSICNEPGLFNAEHIAKFVIELDNDTIKKELLRKKGKEAVYSSFDICTIGQKWQTFLSELCS